MSLFGRDRPPHPIVVALNELEEAVAKVRDLVEPMALPVLPRREDGSK